MPPEFCGIHEPFGEGCERRTLRIKEFGIIHHDNNRCGWRCGWRGWWRGWWRAGLGAAGCIWSVGKVRSAVRLGAAGGEYLGEGFHISPGLRGASITSRDKFGREARAQVTMRVNKEEPRERGYMR